MFTTTTQSPITSDRERQSHRSFARSIFLSQHVTFLVQQDEDAHPQCHQSLLTFSQQEAIDTPLQLIGMRKVDYLLMEPGAMWHCGAH